MSDAVERAAEVLLRWNVRHGPYFVIGDGHVFDTDDPYKPIAQALANAGLLVTPERDAAVAAEWADHFEVCQGAVGPEPLTVESMIAALRGPRPFGRMAGESDADAAK